MKFNRMTPLLKIILTLLLVASCGTLEGNKQRMYKISDVFGPLGVNSYGYFHVKGTKTSCTTINDYKGLIKNLEKALKWNGTKKSSDMSKEIDTYTTCKMNVTYNYTVKSNKSYVSICFQNPSYQHIIDRDCATITELDKAIAELKTVPSHMKKLNIEIKEMEGLK